MQLWFGFVEAELLPGSQFTLASAGHFWLIDRSGASAASQVRVIPVQPDAMVAFLCRRVPDN